jgi:Domain of unknown function (DUF4410)
METRPIQQTFLSGFSRVIVGTAILCFWVIGAAMAQDNSDKSGANQSTISSAVQSKVIYVSDFALDASKSDNASSQNQSDSSPSTTTKQAARAKKLVDLMSKSLVAELNKAGFSAYRVSSGEMPTAGLLLTGTFTQMEQGSGVRRAFIGFGSGAAHVEVFTKVVDISHPETSLYEFSTNQSSGKKPGAVITPSPAIAGLNLILTKNAPEKTVKKGAHQIASELTKQLNSSLIAASN